MSEAGCWTGTGLAEPTQPAPRSIGFPWPKVAHARAQPPARCAAAELLGGIRALPLRGRQCGAWARMLVLWACWGPKAASFSGLGSLEPGPPAKRVCCRGPAATAPWPFALREGASAAGRRCKEVGPGPREPRAAQILPWRRQGAQVACQAGAPRGWSLGSGPFHSHSGGPTPLGVGSGTCQTRRRSRPDPAVWLREATPAQPRTAPCRKCCGVAPKPSPRQPRSSRPFSRPEIFEPPNAEILWPRVGCWARGHEGALAGNIAPPGPPCKDCGQQPCLAQATGQGGEHLLCQSFLKAGSRGGPGTGRKRGIDKSAAWRMPEDLCLEQVAALLVVDAVRWRLAD